VWTFRSDDLVAYVFSANRSGETPRNVLGGTTGTLLVDGYTGYNQVCKPNHRERAGCLAHVRRALFDAMRSAPELQEALDLILDVYRVEHKAMAAGIVRTPAHAELRRTEGKAAMDALHTWLITHKDNHLPTSAAGQAIGYALNQWSHLTVFLGLVHVPIDNNKSERMLRVLARGRSSYLFVGTDDAGQNLAILMSLVLTAELCGKVKEVLVFADDDRPNGQSVRPDVRIRQAQAACERRDVLSVLALCAQPFGQARRQLRIHQEFHAAFRVTGNSSWRACRAARC